MDNTDERNALGRRIKKVLKASKVPLSVEDIAKTLGASKYDVFDALNISLHGWVEMKDSKFRLL